MEEKRVHVSYALELTGSRFFDTVILMRAKELVDRFPGLDEAVGEGNRLRLWGDLDPEAAERLREELAMYPEEEE